MKQAYKVSLVVALSVVVTFFLTAYFLKENSTKTLVDMVIRTSIQMESFNDVGRVEAYDFLEDLVIRGCDKEALEFIKHQQTSLLLGLQSRMIESEAVRKQVMERNQKIGERAVKQIHQGAYFYPKCK
jgi:hypothetical protein